MAPLVRLRALPGADGKRVATGSRGHTAKVWNAETGKELFALGDGTARIWTVAWSPNGERLAVASYTTQVRDAHTGKELLTLHAHRVVSTVVWSPDGKQLATGSECNEAKVWDAETGKELLTLGGLPTFHGCNEER
jgi:WD40 repeat protein